MVIDSRLWDQEFDYFCGGTLICGQTQINILASDPRVPTPRWRCCEPTGRSKQSGARLAYATVRNNLVLIILPHTRAALLNEVMKDSTVIPPTLNLPASAKFNVRSYGCYVPRSTILFLDCLIFGKHVFQLWLRLPGKNDDSDDKVDSVLDPTALV